RSLQEYKCVLADGRLGRKDPPKGSPFAHHKPPKTGRSAERSSSAQPSRAAGLLGQLRPRHSQLGSQRAGVASLLGVANQTAQLDTILYQRKSQAAPRDQIVLNGLGQIPFHTFSSLGQG